ncbi:GNAT family N-acetyltransferase [Streptomyces sp. BR123]|uniref:GNAT family N-acetyltransferase n=1 Tax=Streptomyces sp. BR123 TaxID=2749828 RepID=UPI0015C4446C|nr:GNAT family N-acetyltransferase [Streptomyces sp. BR123]NXY93593.1 GNAT family N-acetyltransferase [Streptomyces sp. BR123]
MDDARRGPVRHATAADEDDVVAVLCDAFSNDPVCRWIIPDPVRRRELLPSVFRAFTREAAADGRVYLAGDGLGALLLVNTPARDGDHDRVRGSGAASSAQRSADLAQEFADRLLTCTRLLAAHHPGEPAHLYIPLVGARRGHQGRGIGSTLVASALAESAGAPVYLEATSRRSLRLYRRLGFARRGPELRLPDGPALFPAWWDPSSGCTG